MLPVRTLHGRRGNRRCLDTFGEAGKMEKARVLRITGAETWDNRCKLAKFPNPLWLGCETRGAPGSPFRKAQPGKRKSHGVAFERRGFPAAGHEKAARICYTASNAGARRPAGTRRRVCWMTGQEEANEQVQLELARLRQEHRDLDAAIDAMVSLGTADTIQIQRLKKRKLVLKDRIKQLEDQTVPDIIA